MYIYKCVYCERKKNERQKIISSNNDDDKDDDNDDDDKDDDAQGPWMGRNCKLFLSRVGSLILY